MGLEPGEALGGGEGAGGFEEVEEGFEVVLAVVGEEVVDGGDEVVVGGDGVEAGVVDGLGEPFVDFEGAAVFAVEVVGAVAEVGEGGGFGATPGV